LNDIFRLTLRLPIVALCSLAGSVFAQAQHLVSASRLEVGGWVFQAAYTLTETGSAATVDNIIAFAQPGAAVGDNLVAVWYQRNNGAWSSKSWLTTDRDEVVKSIKTALTIPDSQDSKWAAGGGSFLATAEVAKAYGAGVLADDPIAVMLEHAPDRDVIVELLASAGYKAAAVPADQSTDCGTFDQLDGMAAELYLMVNMGDESVWQVASMAPMCQSLGKGWKTTPPPGYTPRAPCPGCTPAPWTPPGTPWFPDITFPITPNKNLPYWQQNPICVTTTTGCRCTTYGQSVSTTPGAPMIPTRIKCVYPGPCPDPAPSSLAPGAGCTDEYYY
jgi:hypothetical protein